MRDHLGDALSLPHRARSPFLAIERGHLRADGHCLLLARENETMEIPVAAVSAILLEPGVTVTHEAVKLAAEHETLLVWTGEAGVRVYSAGMPGGKHGSRLLKQAQTHLDPEARLRAAQRLYSCMFEESMRESRSIEKLRGIEGARVKALYHEIARSRNIVWRGRDQAPEALRDALGFATSCLYGLAETAILAAGYSPAIGVVHSGNARSLVFDLADTVKFKTVIPAAFDVYLESPADIGNRVRRRCRDIFREEKMAETLFANLFEIFGEHVDCPGA